MGVGTCVLHTNRQRGEMRKNQTLKEILDIGSIYIDIDGALMLDMVRIDL